MAFEATSSYGSVLSRDTKRDVYQTVQFRLDKSPFPLFFKRYFKTFELFNFSQMIATFF
jgi:hypothetical protein